MPLPTETSYRRPGRRGRPWTPRWESLEDRALLSVATGLGPNTAPDVIGAPYAPGQVLVQFRRDAGEAARVAARALTGGVLAEQIPTAAAKAGRAGSLERIALPAGVDVQDAIRRLEKNPAVEYAQPNWIYSTQAFVPDDPYYTGGNLWGMEGDTTSPANAYGGQAAEAWRDGYLGSTQVVVGVIDTGIDYNHPDLAANVWTNPGEIAGNGIDDDHDGYIDDVHGYDFVNQDSDPMDDNSHGTHVSGTIGAVGGNGQGVVGMSPNVRIAAAKFLDASGNGTTADAIRAVQYFVGLKNRGVNVAVLNASWGGGDGDPALRSAIVDAAKVNILFVAAAGNGDWLGRAVNNDTTPFYPANHSTLPDAGYDSVIAVTAIDSQGNKASWANYGATTVDLGAPGVNIYSTVPGGGYGLKSGTSMAAPHVTGAVALYAAAYPGATGAQIRQAILDQAVPTSSLSGRTVTGGRLDVRAALSVVPPSTSPPDGAPSGLGATAVSSSQINLTWTDNSTNEAGFKIEDSTDGGATFSPLATVGAGVTSYSATALSAATPYSFRVYAYNGAGISGFSNVSSATTPAALAAPSNLGATAASTSQIDLTWTDNSSGEDGFKVEISTDGTSFSPLATVGAGVTSYSATGLSESTRYSFRVYAYSSTAGNSAFSNTASAMTLSAPSVAISESFDTSNPKTNGQWTFINGSWDYTSESGHGGILRQTATSYVTSGEERKALWTGITGTPTEITAQVKVLSLQKGEYARGGLTLYSDASGHGFNLVLTGKYNDPGKKNPLRLEFVYDGVLWSGNSVKGTWTTNTWYWMRVQVIKGTDGRPQQLNGKIWASGTSEPTGWTITYVLPESWKNPLGHYAGLNGSTEGVFTGQGLSYATMAFDSVTVKGPGIALGSGPGALAATGASPASTDTTPPLTTSAGLLDGSPRHDLALSESAARAAAIETEPVIVPLVGMEGTSPVPQGGQDDPFSDLSKPRRTR